MRAKIISNEEITYLLDLCLNINARGKDTVFFDYSAHVGEISVRVHLGGGGSGIGPDEKFEFYVSGKGCNSASRIDYDACLIYLEGLLYA